MINVWILARWLHLVAAITWIGGMIFILVVLLPVVRPALAPDRRALLVGQVGVRFGFISLAALIILLVTGYINGDRRNVDWTDLTATTYGTRLLIKLLLVGVIVIITMVHAWYGQRIVNLARLPDDEKSEPWALAQRRRLHITSGALSAMNLILNLVVVWIAASLIA